MKQHEEATPRDRSILFCIATCHTHVHMPHVWVGSAMLLREGWQLDFDCSVVLGSVTNYGQQDNANEPRSNMSNLDDNTPCNSGRTKLGTLWTLSTHQSSPVVLQNSRNTFPDSILSIVL